jgi:hypothetical protein
MSKKLEQLSRNLANGMSRRKAFWSFVTGIGAAGTLAGTAFGDDHFDDCEDYCEAQAQTFQRICMAAARSCSGDHCPQVINFNGGLEIRLNGSTVICVPVKR